MLCVITHIHKDSKDHPDNYHWKQVINLINFFMSYLKTKWLLLKTYFRPSKQNLITRMVHLMGINLSGKAKTSDMVTVICGIKNIHFLAPRFLVLFHVESHQRLLVLVQQSLLEVMWRQISLGNDLISSVMYQRNRVLLIYLPVLNHLELNKIIMIKN